MITRQPPLIPPHPFKLYAHPKRKPVRRTLPAQLRYAKAKAPKSALTRARTSTERTMRYPLAPYAVKPESTRQLFGSTMIDTVALRVAVRHKAFHRIAEGNLNVKRHGSYELRVKSAFSKNIYARMFSRDSRETLFIEVSVPKFLTGQNIVGKEELHEQCVPLILAVLHRAGIRATDSEIDAIRAGHYEMIRVDHTVHCDCGSPERASAVMASLRSLVFAKAKDASAYGIETVYVSQHSSRWTLRIYRKDLELMKRSRCLPANVYGREQLLAKVEGCVRLELVLRAPELKRLGLSDPLAWSAADARARMTKWIERLAQLDGRVPSLAGMENLTNFNQLKLGAWLLGDHGAFSGAPTTTALSRKAILNATGVDVRGEANVALQRQAVTCLRDIFVQGIGFKSFPHKWAQLLDGREVPVALELKL
jgi:hypothetical protein